MFLRKIVLCIFIFAVTSAICNSWLCHETSVKEEIALVAANSPLALLLYHFNALSGRRWAIKKGQILWRFSAQRVLFAALLVSLVVASYQSEVIDKLRLLFYLRVRAKSAEDDKIRQTRPTDRPTAFYLYWYTKVHWIYLSTNCDKSLCAAVVGTLFASHQKIYPDARSSGATLKSLRI